MPLTALVAVALGLIGAVSVVGWRFAHPAIADPATTLPAAHVASEGGSSEVTALAVPDQVWTATLRDDLFPPPPPPPEPPAPPAPKPPELALRVIATGERGVFVFDEVAAEHVWLRAGERSGSGAVVKSIGDTLVVFELEGRQLQREVAR